MEKHIEVLHKIADLLIEKERVSGEEIRSLFPKGVLIEKETREGLMREPLEAF
jgi:ATP-dependent Zn protease